MQSEVEKLVDRLKHLVSLNEPRNGGPYQGAAAVACVEAMADAASLIETLYRREEAATEQLDKCAALLEVISENAMARDDTVEWAMASVMAKDARALAGDHGQ